MQGEEPCRSQSHHPPLFYWLGAAATAGIQQTKPICHSPPVNPFWAYRFEEVGVDNKNLYLPNPDHTFPWWGEGLAAHLLRALNVMIGAGAVWVTWRAGKTVYPSSPEAALIGAALLAFNPMFLYVSGAINNDALAAFCGGLILWLCARLWRDPAGLSRRWAIMLGAAYGVSLLAKMSLAAAAVVIGATISWQAWRRQQRRLWFEAAALSIATAALLAGWWFVRNYQLYGDLTGFEMVKQLWGARIPSESWELARLELPAAWSSLWGRFGYGQIPLPAFIYRLLGWLTGLGLLGAALGWERRWRQTGEKIGGGALLSLHALLFFAVLFNYMLVSPAGSMGRFFFPGLPALTLLVGCGFSNWFQWMGLGKGVWRKRGAAITIAGMFTLALWALFGYLRPAYARPPSFAADAPLPNPVEIQFDYFARLRGYELSQSQIQPGQPLEVALYWEATGSPPGEYLFFLHLIDLETGAVVAQRDSHPGLGKFPTGLWQVGDRFVERVAIYLPDAAYSPSRLAVSVGLYAPDSYRLPATDAAGIPIGDAAPLGEVAVASAAADFPNPQNKNFNQIAVLQGYDLPARRAAVNEPLSIRLFWQSIQPQGGLLQLHLLTGDGDFVTGVEQPLPAATGAQMVELAGAVDAGIYQLVLSVIDPASKKRLPIVAEDGHWLDDKLPLTAIRVE